MVAVLVSFSQNGSFGVTVGHYRSPKSSTKHHRAFFGRALARSLSDHKLSKEGRPYIGVRDKGKVHCGCARFVSLQPLQQRTMSLSSTATIKQQLTSYLGAKGPSYFDSLNNFITGRISRSEFDDALKIVIDAPHLGRWHHRQRALSMLISVYLNSLPFTLTYWFSPAP